MTGEAMSTTRAGADYSAGRALALTARDVAMSYIDRSSGDELLAIERIDLDIHEGEFVSIVGPSGCGKSTLLKIIAGLLEPTSGSVVFTPAENGRPRNGLVFQDHGVFPWMTVLDNVAFGLEMQGVARRERYRRAIAFVEQVGLATFLHSYPHELSVGMRQRVGIARAFVADVPLLLMDEPFGSLDAQTRVLLQEELLRIWRDHRKLIVFVTHDIEEAVLLGDRVLVMTGRPGRILEEVRVTLARPRSPMRPEISELRWSIWRHLEHDARSELSSGS